MKLLAQRVSFRLACAKQLPKCLTIYGQMMAVPFKSS